MRVILICLLLSGCALTQPDEIRCEVHTYEGGGELTASGHESTAELSVLLERCTDLTPPASQS